MTWGEPHRPEDTVRLAAVIAAGNALVSEGIVVPAARRRWAEAVAAWEAAVGSGG